jgi:predicted metal-dependent phosphoesterase TrpH
MKIDMHVHTRCYSACSNIKPHLLIEKAQEVGLDGVVITEHNVCWPESEKEKLRAQSQGLKLFFGVEVNVRQGEHYLVYIKDSIELPSIYEDMGEEELFHKVHSVGGAIIAAHPFRFNREFERKFLRHYPVDGLEVMSTNINNKDTIRTSDLAEKTNLCRIASSDAHSLKAIGRYYTIFEEKINSESDLIRAIKNKKCKPYL